MSEATGPLADLLEHVLSRLGTVESQLGITPAAGGGGGGGGGAKKVSKEDPKSIRAYDEYLR